MGDSDRRDESRSYRGSSSRGRGARPYSSSDRGNFTSGGKRSYAQFPSPDRDSNGFGSRRTRYPSNDRESNRHGSRYDSYSSNNRDSRTSRYAPYPSNERDNRGSRYETRTSSDRDSRTSRYAQYPSNDRNNRGSRYAQYPSNDRGSRGSRYENRTSSDRDNRGSRYGTAPSSDRDKNGSRYGTDPSDDRDSLYVLYPSPDNESNNVGSAQAETEQQHGSEHSSRPTSSGFKKYRKENEDPVNPTPSKVLHIRNLTEEVTEAAVVNALSHFGNVAYVTMMPNGHMALAEFESMENARECVEYSINHSIMINDNPILINYSTSSKIKRSGLESDQISKVLVIKVTNIRYPVDIEVLNKICSEYGRVNRISLIKRTEYFKALVEFDNEDEARKAKYGLNGADVYDECCNLKVEFSSEHSVRVKANDETQWDFTINPSLEQIIKDVHGTSKYF